MFFLHRKKRKEMKSCYGKHHCKTTSKTFAKSFFAEKLLEFSITLKKLQENSYGEKILEILQRKVTSKTFSKNNH